MTPMKNPVQVMRLGKAILHRLKFNWQIYWRDIRVSIEMTFSLTYNAPFFQLKTHVHIAAAETRWKIIESMDP
jgi:hypothetical protein